MFTRHLDHQAESTRGMLMPYEVRLDVASCCVGKMTASHLSKKRTRPLDSAKFLTMEI